MSAKPLVLAAALCAAAAGRASAEPVLDGVSWQAARVERGRVAAWQDVKVVSNPPPKLVNRLRVRVLLKNRGPKPVEGILLRFGMTARLTPTAGTGASSEGAWAIPFAIGEKRVPFVGPNKTVEVSLDPGDDLVIYLRRVARAGWWPDRLKMQVMLDLHPGATSIQTSEDVVELGR
jgi:hypothetical protein